MTENSSVVNAIYTRYMACKTVQAAEHCQLVQSVLTNYYNCHCYQVKH